MTNMILLQAQQQGGGDPNIMGGGDPNIMLICRNVYLYKILGKLRSDLNAWFFKIFVQFPDLPIFI